MDPGDGGDGGVEQFIPLLKIYIIYKMNSVSVELDLNEIRSNKREEIL
jgi:hypothetical protein